MGLQSQLNDVSSDSIPILLVAIMASCVAYLRSAILGLAHRLGSRGPIQDGLTGLVGSGLAGLIVLADQLSLNREFSYTKDGDGDDSGDCVVCMSAISRGDRIRRLTCRHVFHKGCLDACIGHLSFKCPLCRSPFASNDRSVDVTLERGVGVGSDPVAWLSSTP